VDIPQGFQTYSQPILVTVVVVSYDGSGPHVCMLTSPNLCACLNKWEQYFVNVMHASTKPFELKNLRLCIQKEKRFAVDSKKQNGHDNNILSCEIKKKRKNNIIKKCAIFLH
jgi:hypothetical protein